MRVRRSPVVRCLRGVVELSMRAITETIVCVCLSCAFIPLCACTFAFRLRLKLLVRFVLAVFFRFIFSGETSSNRA